ncbi:class I SAM-dependent methyltransferase [Paenibacillaceae bacterium WGS1546]|uniref:class I SAM-dependent methyltransferase n=1 Tax=Cohnella sp. WGS1546 TaxID=3366810 RepID=UPI00372CF51B
MNSNWNMNVYEMLILAFVVACLLAALSIVWTSWRNGIGPMPSSLRVRRAVAAEVNRLGDGGLLIEAGSGWGTLGLHLGKHCRGWRVEGVENSPVPLAISRVASRLAFRARRAAGGSEADRPSVTFRKGDLYDQSYRDARAVVFYQHPGAMRRLGPLLAEQLQPGARVVSVCFALPGWQPERVVACNDLYRTRIYVYRQP